MLGKLFECEADKNRKYYKVIQTINEYRDGNIFPIDEVVVANKEINLNALDNTEMGGFCVTTYNCCFRWLIRGDSLCEVIIPEDGKLLKTISDSGIYVCDKMILRNPRKIDDDFAMELYKASSLNETSYFRAMMACAICGYINTALKVCEDRVNTQNVSVAISECKDYCKQREKRNYSVKTSDMENVKRLFYKLREIQNKKSS